LSLVDSYAFSHRNSRPLLHLFLGHGREFQRNVAGLRAGFLHHPPKLSPPPTEILSGTPRSARRFERGAKGDNAVLSGGVLLRNKPGIAPSGRWTMSKVKRTSWQRGRARGGTCCSCCRAVPPPCSCPFRALVPRVGRSACGIGPVAVCGVWGRHTGCRRDGGGGDEKIFAVSPKPTFRRRTPHRSRGAVRLVTGGAV